MRRYKCVPVFYNDMAANVFDLPEKGVFVMKYGHCYSKVMRNEVIETVTNIVNRKVPFWGNIELSDFIDNDNKNGRAA